MADQQDVDARIQEFLERTGADMMEGVRRSTMDEPAAATLAADKALVF